MPKMIEDRCAPEPDRLAAVRELLEDVDEPFIFARFAVDGGANVTENVNTPEDWMTLVGAITTIAVDEIRKARGEAEAGAFIERSLAVLPEIAQRR